jgi:WhiB family redox-sensing transcriptional regulator
MSAHAAAGRHYTSGAALPPFRLDPDIMCGPDTADAFFSDARVDEAKALCRVCPLRDACLQYAVDGGIAHGLWGGLTVDERGEWASGQPIPEPAVPVTARCANDHVLDEANLYYRPSRPGQRVCRACVRDAQARAARKRSALAAGVEPLERAEAA